MCKLQENRYYEKDSVIRFAGIDGRNGYAQFFNSQKGTTLYYKSEDFEEKTPLVTTDTSRIVEVLTVGIL